jgi:hypothetical protein
VRKTGKGIEREMRCIQIFNQRERVLILVWYPIFKILEVRSGVDLKDLCLD